MSKTFSRAGRGVRAVPAARADPPPPADPAGGGSGLGGGVGAAALGLAALFTLLCVQWSLSHGRLSQDATYDDCAYLYDGGQRLEVFYEQGLGAFAADLARHPPHAPLTAFGAVLGFALFGLHDWAPYLLNGLIVLGLLALAARAGRGLPRPWRVALLALPLTLPFAVGAVHDFRPDALGALLTAAGAFLAAEGGACLAGRARGRALASGGVCFGLALWAKPPVFALTLLLAILAAAGAALAAALLDPARPGGRAPAALRTAAAVLLPCALAAAPWAAVGGVGAVRYFLYNSFHAESQFWKLPGGWAGSARFYTVGPAGDLLLGRGFRLWLALYVPALAWLGWRRAGRELLLQAILLTLTVAALAAVIYGRINNPFFGATWAALMIAACLRAFAAALAGQRLAGWPGLVGGALLAGLALADLALLRLHKIWPHHHPAVDALVGPGRSLNQRILDDVGAELARRAGPAGPASPAGPPPLTFLTATGFINPATLRWLALREGRPFLVTDLQEAMFPPGLIDRAEEQPLRLANPAPGQNRLDLVRRAVAQAGFVVTAEDKTGGVFENLPTWPLRFAVAGLAADEVRAGRLRPLARYPTSAGGAYSLYANDAALARQAGVFGPFTGWEGFLPPEGPYPQWQLGRVRWAVGPRSGFAYAAAAPGPARLEMWVRAQSPVRVRLRLEDAPAGEWEVAPAPEFRPLRAPVSLRAGENHFTLEYAEPAPADPDGVRRELLFTQLEVQPAP